ncbi:MAG: hypothetical protein Q9Q40_01815 [Acidobacteriota bacterium]|nr:hypothetical protein [Acidobacteriota bacterium]
MRDSRAPVEESRVTVALRGDRESAERLAARLSARGIAARVAVPGPALHDLPPGRWAVEVAGSRVEAALEDIEDE